jgi:hypothetical protein
VPPRRRRSAPAVPRLVAGAAAHRRQGDQPILHGAPVDHAHRHQRVADRARIRALLEPAIDEPLDVPPGDISELARAECGQQTQSQGGRVPPDDRRLVDVARTSAHAAAFHPVDQLLRGLAQRRRGGSSQESVSDRDDSTCAPGLGFLQAVERLALLRPRPPSGTDAS